MLLTVKRLHEVAGYPDLISAMPAVIADHPQATLWIIGEGDRRPELERRVAELRLTRSVRFLGRIDNARLWRYYAAADLFVLPSRLESWGSVSIEALACGTPVVASRTAGSMEVQSYFPDDMALCEVGDPQSLGAPARWPHGSSDTRFRPRACAAAYLDLYERTLREASARRSRRH